LIFVGAVGAVGASGASGLPAQASPAGRLVVDTIHSKAIEHNLYGDSPDRSLLVYLPPSYDVDAARRYPAVYLLHGFASTERSWVRGYSGFNIRGAMDSLVAAGSAREMIIVMPNGRNRFDGSFYSNSTSAGNWDDFIARELVSYVDAKYRTIARPESRGLAGHSMGGYGTFAVGMRHAGDVYGALYSLSGCCTRFSRAPPRPETWDPVFALTSLDSAARLGFFPKVNLALAAAFSPNPANAPLYVDLPYAKTEGALTLVEAVFETWRANAPYDMIPRYRDKLLRLRGLAFDVGTGDALVPPASLAELDSAFTRAGVKHTFETYDGDHVNRIGLRMVTRVLPFFSQTLDFRPH
jgi:enterochelin esterase-like enzyme